MSSADPSFVVETVPWDAFCGLVSSPVLRGDLGGPSGGVVVVRDAPQGPAPPEVVERSRELPVVVVIDASVEAPPASAQVADVVASGDDLEALLVGARASPQAATALALLLRASEERSVFDGLAAESAVYSTLQGGTGFRQWRTENPSRERPAPDGPVVRVTRRGDALDVVLNRPEVRNALDAGMRDELWDAFVLAASDPALSVRWTAEGPSFCSGGHLDEFGSVSDPASGHLIRLTRSLGLAVHLVADRVTAHVHGACAGSGIELPAFAGTLVAAPDARFSLPEMQLGLIPGAGGTVSLPRRIGRHRTAWLALTGRVIDADVALAWGLVDRVEPRPPHW
ncbi:MAG: enoyl-CoA hydratase/isomerase family protein, partial [Acidimicrobiales bacterium]